MRLFGNHVFYYKNFLLYCSSVARTSHFVRRVKLRVQLQYGFSLVELIVVLSILALLIGVFFMTLDPLEYIRRAQDARRQKTAIELYESFVRYYSIKSFFPWNTEPAIPDCLPVFLANQPLGAPGLTRGTDRIQCVQSVIDIGELKTTFIEQNSKILNDLYISDETPTFAGSSKVYVCFLPESKNLRRNVQTTYSESGGKETSGCIIHGGGRVCAWCAR